MRRSRLFQGALVAGVLFLSACGGSDSSDGEADAGSSTTMNSAVSDDSAAVLAFCESANSNDSDLPQIEPSDDAAAITEKVTALASALADNAAMAPVVIKADAQTIADAATAMASALKNDPTLESFDDVVTKFATSEVDAATVAIEKFVIEKCGAAQ